MKARRNGVTPSFKRKRVKTTAIQRMFDLLVTILLWLYFILGFVLLFSLFYLGAYLFSRRRELAFQRLNHLFYKGFFLVLHGLAPRVVWRIPSGIKSIRSCVVVSNHLSYLDPLLLISLFPRHKTIVKSAFFRVPLFGWLMKQSGFIPDDARGGLAELMIERIEATGAYLAHGGNLFVFPEGTRSRDGNVGGFSKGAFKIARRCRAPIVVLRIRGTDRVFAPGRFLFNTQVPVEITVERLAVMAPQDRNGSVPISATMARARSLLQSHPHSSAFADSADFL